MSYFHHSFAQGDGKVCREHQTEEDELVLGGKKVRIWRISKSENQEDFKNQICLPSGNSKRRWRRTGKMLLEVSRSLLDLILDLLDLILDLLDLILVLLDLILELLDLILDLLDLILDLLHLIFDLLDLLFGSL